MNTQVGKSIGIALLLAAGLLAALFAMGVFAPAGVEAGVKGKPKPTYDLSTHKPLEPGVELTVKFEVNDDVDGAPSTDNVKITLTGFTELKKENVKVEQGDKPVGAIGDITDTTDNEGKIITIGFDEDSPALLEDVLTTVTITGLTNGASAGSIKLTQTSGIEELKVPFGPSVTSASFSLSSYAAKEKNVKATLKLTTDTDASNSDPVMITLPKDYDVADKSTNKLREGLKVDTVSPVLFTVVPTPDKVIGNDTGDVLTYNARIEAKEEFTVTITGLSNPTTSKGLVVEFAHEKQTPPLMRTVYITNPNEVKVKVTSLEPRTSGSEKAKLTFEFASIVTDGIVVGLHEDFSGFKATNVTVLQDGEKVVAVKVAEGDNVNEFTIDGVAKDATATTVTITGLTNPDDVGHVPDAVTVTQGNHQAASANINLLGFELSSTSPGALVRITISELAENAIPAGEDITVQLTGFDLPETIAESQIILNGRDEKVDGRADTAGGVLDLADGYYGFPSSVLVSGSNIILSVPAVDGRGNRVPVGVNAGGVYTITFKNGAGISNPSSAGSKTITVTDRDDEATSLVRTILSSTSVSPAAVSRGGTVTVTGGGFASGLYGTVFLVRGGCVDVLDDCIEGDKTPADDADDDFRLGGNLVSGGGLSAAIRTTSSRFLANENDDGPLNDDGNGTNRIAIVDGTGAVSNSFARLAILPTVGLGTESIKQGGLLELELEDWHYGKVVSVHVGGVPVTQRWINGQASVWPANGIAVTAGEAEFIAIMPPGVRLGEQELMLTGTTLTEQGSNSAVDVYKNEIMVDPLDLRVTPVNAEGMPEVVVNQEFTVEGRGFTTIDNACIDSVKVGDIVLPETTAGIDVNCGIADSLKPDTAGNFSGTFKLEPRYGAQRLKVGEYRLEIKDNEGRVGRVDIIIPEPIVRVEPEASRRGSTVTVVGTRFPAGNELAVEIMYGLPGNEKTIGAASPDSSGKWRTTFTVPTTAVIGEEHIVVAVPIEEAFDHFKGKGAHRLPEQELIVTPGRVAAGGRMTLEGHNMPLFTPVKIFISNINILGQGGVVETDGLGSFVRPNVLVPQLQPGTHTLEALVSTQGDRDVSVRTTVEVADIVTRPTDEVFLDLITAGQLTVVWRYDNATSTWASYDPAAPAELNDLEEVSTNEIVWVEVTSTVAFQGGQLYVGWNLITLE